LHSASREFPRRELGTLELKEFVAAGHLTLFDTTGSPWLAALLVFRQPPPLFAHEDSLAARQRRWAEAQRAIASSMPNSAAGGGHNSMAFIGTSGDTVGAGAIRATLPANRGITRVVLIDQPDERPEHWRVAVTVDLTTPIGRLFWPQTETRGARVLTIEAFDRARYMLNWLRQSERVRRWLDDGR
jgi:hypothetical protein